MPYVIKPVGFRSGGDFVDESEIYGYNSWDYFDGEAMQTFPTAEEARTWAAAHYKGQDKDGIGIEWEIVEGY